MATDFVPAILSPCRVKWHFDNHLISRPFGGGFFAVGLGLDRMDHRTPVGRAAIGVAADVGISTALDARIGDASGSDFYAQLSGNLRQGTSFFASATMIALGSGLALMGNTDRLTAI